MFSYLEKHFNLYQYHILGVDEAGRGNWAGPMVVAGCILSKELFNCKQIHWINDSKKLSKKQRIKAFAIIQKYATYCFEVIDVDLIDQIGPKKAAIWGMQKVISQLQKKADYIFVDYELPLQDEKLHAFVHGDALSINIAAASIIAKCIKDQLMQKFVSRNPKLNVYDFVNNAGYGTKKHLMALQQYGKIPHFHRFSYKPIQKITLINRTPIRF